MVQEDLEQEHLKVQKVQFPKIARPKQRSIGDVVLIE